MAARVSWQSQRALVPIGEKSSIKRVIATSTCGMAGGRRLAAVNSKRAELEKTLRGCNFCLLLNYWIFFGASLIPIPLPHPLDFDWRYSDETVNSITECISKSATVIAGGTPSVARRLDAEARDAILVDRQPFQAVKKHIIGDIEEVQLKVQNGVAVLDPPWYPAEAMQWIAWASSVVGVGGEILVSLWPAHTRPSGGNERADLHRWMSEWANVSQTNIPITYIAPKFEDAASATAKGIDTRSAPRYGELLRISVKQEQTAVALIQRSTRWTRFTINEYQLAVREQPPTSGMDGIAQVNGADGWIWPHVSRRAAGRNEIALWSSHNEVAVVGNSAHLIESLRAYVRAEFSQADLLSEYPQLAEWSIPAPPFWRAAEWQHQQ